MVAICFVEPDERGYAVAASGFTQPEVAEEERKRLRKATRWKYELQLVEYEPVNLKGGIITTGKILSKHKTESPRQGFANMVK